MASLGFMKYEAMPTLKQSVSVEYNDNNHDYIRKAAIEVALPTSWMLDNKFSPQFVKLEAKN